jgi:hypothetical protein
VKRFATYPYIGSNYGKNKKILFIGLDIGQDEGEKNNSILSFNEKRNRLEKELVKKYNAHISGLMMTTIYLLKDKNKEYSVFWNNVKSEKSMQSAIKKWGNFNNNPVTLTTFTNIYKYVKIGRKKRQNGKDRKFIKKDLELELLIDEINILQPDYIILQTKSENERKRFSKIIPRISKQTKVYFIPHPSWWVTRNPQKYIKYLEKVN